VSIFCSQLWTRHLANGDVAVGCYNRGTMDPEHPNSPAADGPAADCTFKFSELGLKQAKAYLVRDVWTGRESSVATSAYTAKAVPHHGTALLRVSVSVKG
jgi:hypothetical protein